MCCLQMVLTMLPRHLVAAQFLELPEALFSVDLVCGVLALVSRGFRALVEDCVGPRVVRFDALRHRRWERQRPTPSSRTRLLVVELTLAFGMDWDDRESLAAALPPADTRSERWCVLRLNVVEADETAPSPVTSTRKAAAAAAITNTTAEPLTCLSVRVHGALSTRPHGFLARQLGPLLLPMPRPQDATLVVDVRFDPLHTVAQHVVDLVRVLPPRCLTLDLRMPSAVFHDATRQLAGTPEWTERADVRRLHLDWNHTPRAGTDTLVFPRGGVPRVVVCMHPSFGTECLDLARAIGGSLRCRSLRLDWGRCQCVSNLWMLAHHFRQVEAVEVVASHRTSPREILYFAKRLCCHASRGPPLPVTTRKRLRIDAVSLGPTSSAWHREGDRWVCLPCNKTTPPTHLEPA